MRYRIVFAIGFAAALCWSLLAHLSAQATGLTFPGVENWDNTIGAINITRTVHSLAFDQNALYIGEGFGSGGKHIRRWDGQNWQSIATNVDGPVLALLSDGNGNLYAGGYFNQTGTCDPCKRVAFWNGSNWFPVGSGLNGEVLALARDSSGTLYAGGNFGDSGVMRWNGSAWISETITDTVYVLAVDTANRIYAAGRGYFIDPDSGDQTEFPSLKVKDQSGWQDLGQAFVNSGPNGIFSLALYPANVLTPTVGGDFGSPTFYLATWKNGWQTLGILNELVLALAADTCGGLYVGGMFSRIDSSAHKLLAYFDGTTWQSLGNTFTNDSDKIETLRFYHGYLAVGGVFTQTFGTQRYRNIALWTGRDCAQINASGTYTFYNWREPVVIEIENPGTLAEIRVQRFNKDHPNADTNTTPNLRNGVYWQIEGLDSSGHTASGLAYTITLPSVSFTPDEKDKICHYLGNSTWDCAASAYDPVKKTITRGGLTSFSDFTIGNDVGPTVVTLRSVRAQGDGGFVIVLLLGLLTVAFWALQRKIGECG